jgi:hypothetical protein
MYKELSPPEDLMRWLSDKDSEDAAGTACNSDFCPLALWLNETIGMEKPAWRSNFVVGNTLITGLLPNETQVSWRHKVWSLSFMRRIDFTFWSVVPAKNAMAILAQVLEETAKLSPEEALDYLRRQRVHRHLQEGAG